MELMSDLPEDSIDKAHELIDMLESNIEEGVPPSESQVKKLNDLF